MVPVARKPKDSSKFKLCSGRKKTGAPITDRKLRNRLKLVASQSGETSVTADPMTQRIVYMATTRSQMGSDRPMTMQDSIIAARAFQGSEIWVVDNYNCLAALLALADRQPSELYLIARDDAEEDMPNEVVEEIAKRAKNCKISIRFVDSFLKPCGTITDRRRLELMMANGSLFYERFYGYLDYQTVVNTLPSTLVSIGLAIKNASDAAMVNSLRLEKMNAALRHLNISVSSEVAIEALQPLDKSFDGKKVHLTFPYLTDKCVNNVRPAIDVLTTGRGFAGLFFPKSRMTGAGARRLVPQLDGTLVEIVNIEPGETWKQDEKEKESIEEMMRKVGLSVEWNVDWMYGESPLSPA